MLKHEGHTAVRTKIATILGKSVANIGDGSATSYAVNHNLGSRDVIWQLYRNSGSFDDGIPDVQRTSINQITVLFEVAPTAAQWRVVVMLAV